MANNAYSYPAISFCHLYALVPCISSNAPILMTSVRYTFPKSEHLTSKKTINELFTSGQSLFQYPFKILYLVREEEADNYPKVLISVSKRQFKKAVDRNKVKRLIREAYRLQKPHLISLPNHLEALAFIYVGKSIEPYAKFEKGMKKGLGKLQGSPEA